MGLPFPRWLTSKTGSFFNWNSLGSQDLGPIPVEEEDTGMGRCSGAWLDTARDWGLPVDHEATLHLPDRKPREARGRRGRQTVMSSLTRWECLHLDGDPRGTTHTSTVSVHTPCAGTSRHNPLHCLVETCTPPPSHAHGPP